MYRTPIGWRVAIRRAGGIVAFRYFGDRRHGGRNEALLLAVAWRDLVLKRLPPATLVRLRYGPNTTGVIGVQLTRERSARGGPADRYRASWYELDGRLRMRGFSVAKYGARQAKRLAAEARREALARILAERRRVLKRS